MGKKFKKGKKKQAREIVVYNFICIIEVDYFPGASEKLCEESARMEPDRWSPSVPREISQPNLIDGYL